jgi:hypothetical protein
MAELDKPSNFIRHIIDADLKAASTRNATGAGNPGRLRSRKSALATRRKFAPGFRPSPTATCTSATQSRSA